MAQSKKRLAARISLSVICGTLIFFYLVEDPRAYAVAILPALGMSLFNFYAYATNKFMFPATTPALEGGGKGDEKIRNLVFWLTATYYLAILIFFLVI
jgi:hypothetical protein